MNTDLTLARELLKKEGCTCVLCKDTAIYKSTARGVRSVYAHIISCSALQVLEQYHIPVTYDVLPRPS